MGRFFKDGYWNRKAIPFTPADLGAALAGWWKADGTLWQDSARTTPAAADGDRVGAWDDASGNGRHAVQATADKRFTLKTGVNGQNGIPVALADGLDDWLDTGPFTLNQPFTLYLVMKMLSVGAASVNDIVVGFSGNPNVLAVDNSPVSSLYAGFGLNYAGKVADGAFASVTARFSGASSILRENGTQRAVGDAGPGNGARVTLAALNEAGIRPTNVAFGEIILTTSADPLSTMQRVEAYLKAKWGTP